MASKSIGSAVGKQPALNSVSDQFTIVTLLNRVMPEDGGPQYALPNPTTVGTASPELIAAIMAFQKKHNPPVYRDGRVDPHGFTLKKLNELARSQFPVTPSFPTPDPPPSPSPIEIDGKVWSHITRVLAANASYGELERLWNAAGDLKGDRNRLRDGKPYNCQDKPLAYAEHYMLSRAFVASGGHLPTDSFAIGRSAMWVLATALISTYDLGKLANAMVAAAERLAGDVRNPMRKFLFALVYKLGECPVSDAPPDPTSVAWGIKGAGDGMRAL